MEIKFARASTDHATRELVGSGDYDRQRLFVQKRFDVTLWYGDRFRCWTLYPVQHVSYRLREMGYFDGTADNLSEEYPITISEHSFKIARPKIFRTNLRTSPIDLISWIVAGRPRDQAEGK